MEYCLPHAVLALLQEENTPHLPKSYFISSSTKTTKITLIYTRRRRESDKPEPRRFKTRRRPNIFSSDGGADDYRRRARNLSHGDFVGMQSAGHNARICASTPGRGYNDSARVRSEGGRHLGAAKMPTDPLKRSPSKDRLPIGQFPSYNAGHNGSDSDVSHHYGALSPHSSAGDRPPTPGKNFFSPSSPRPPTPNFSNYASLLSVVAHGDPAHASSDDRDLSPPPTPCLRRSNDIDSNSQHTAKGISVPQHKTSSNPNVRSSGQSTRTALPSIKIQSSSPATPPKQRKDTTEIPGLNTKPSYHRNQSWEGPHRYR